MAITFTVLGLPATKGSTRSFVDRSGRLVTKADAAGLGAWTQAVKWAAKGAGVRVVAKPGSVVVAVRFEFPRPVSAKKRPHPTVKPDIDKTLRACLDALTGIAYDDDAQVIEVAAVKAYATEAATHITVRAA